MSSKLPIFTRTQHHHNLQSITGTSYHRYSKLNTVSVKKKFFMEKDARENFKQNTTITGIRFSKFSRLDSKSIMQSLLGDTKM